MSSNFLYLAWVLSYGQFCESDLIFLSDFRCHRNVVDFHSVPRDKYENIAFCQLRKETDWLLKDLERGTGSLMTLATFPRSQRKVDCR